MDSPSFRSQNCTGKADSDSALEGDREEDVLARYHCPEHQQICELAHPIWSCIPRLFILFDIIRLELAAVIVSLNTTLGAVASTEFVKGSDHLGAIEVAVGARDKEATVARADAAGAFVAAGEVAVARLNLVASSIQCRASARVGVLSMRAPQQHDDHEIHKTLRASAMFIDFMVTKLLIDLEPIIYKVWAGTEAGLALLSQQDFQNLGGQGGTQLKLHGLPREACLTLLYKSQLV
ncbi:hypothetical protein SELMODRAFT_417644 [Selaginella moellendorffii]|uniref:Uncharacterized protein n=1 Tax=Selaginella moellendorffii TaxID=88036 RepID=D8S342_SELML|nr:hypothetical protein SELMODRAFT_417644 [Selaginella moellendorffii]